MITGVRPERRPSTEPTEPRFTQDRFTQLADKIEQGQYSREDALSVARAILFDSPQSLLGMTPRKCGTP